jgi:hypothetical protein
MRRFSRLADYLPNSALTHFRPAAAMSRASPKAGRRFPSHHSLSMPQKKKINVAIVGLGFRSRIHSPLSGAPRRQMYAICQRTEKKLNAIGDAFGVDERYTDFKQMLKNPNIDLVHINSPIPDHGWQTIARQGRQTRLLHGPDGDLHRGDARPSSSCARRPASIHDG